MEEVRQKVFNFKLSKIGPSKINEKQKEVFEQLKYAGKLILFPGNILKNVDTDEHWFFMLQGTKTFLKSLIYFVIKKT